MKLIFALLLILCLNAVFYIAQVSITKASFEIVGDEAPVYFTNDNLINKFDSDGNFTLIDPSLPNDEYNREVSGDSSGIFIDTWKSLKGWVLDSTGVGFIINIVNALPNFLKIMGTPQEVAFALGFIWHALTLTLIVMFIRGGN